MSQVEIEQVRRDARYCLRPDSFGDDLESSKVDEFKAELVDMLEARGYKERVYRMDQDMETIAYIKDKVPFRKEPILLDDGGSIIPQSEEQLCGLLSKIGKPHDPNDIDPMGGDYVLKIAIRDAGESNEALHDTIVRLLVKYGIVNPNDESFCPPIEGTIVYALKRFNDSVY